MVLYEMIYNNGKYQLKAVEEFEDPEVTGIYPAMTEFESFFQSREFAIEHSYVMTFDEHKMPTGIYCASIGDINSTGNYNRPIFLFCILIGATYFCTIHNHPKCNKAIPSDNDIANESEKEALSKMMGIDYLGEVIVAKNEFAVVNINGTEKYPWDEEELEEDW